LAGNGNPSLTQVAVVAAARSMTDTELIRDLS